VQLLPQPVLLWGVDVGGRHLLLLLPGIPVVPLQLLLLWSFDVGGRHVLVLLLLLLPPGHTLTCAIRHPLR
jgi:hypothetical protein